MMKSTAKTFGELTKNELEINPRFYYFCPDETTSNKFTGVYDVTPRAWADLPIKNQDLPEGGDGRVIEMLSENTLFAVLLGHVMSGEPGLMLSYESFFPIVTSQVLQHIKFLDQSDQVSWREPVPALNLLSTSVCWRQDHNGYTHQSPMLISTLLERPGNKVNCFFPCDSESAKVVFKYMLTSENVVNLTTFDKNETPQYIDENHAKYQLENGASVFGFASDGDAFNLQNPINKFDFIFTAAGDLMTREALAAMSIIREDLPELKLRFVNILALTHDKIGTQKSPMSQETFDSFYGKTAPIIANFHGYPDTLKYILENYTDKNRIYVHGYEEHGSTTTPFEMLSLNHASRFDLAKNVAEILGREDLVKKYQAAIDDNRKYAYEFGIDKINIDQISI